MQLALNYEFIESPKVILKSSRVVLSKRDYEIFRFLLEMKFASLEDIFEKFFSIVGDNELAKNCHWTKKRLYQLEKSKYIKAVKTQIRG